MKMMRMLALVMPLALAACGSPVAAEPTGPLPPQPTRELVLYGPAGSTGSVPHKVLAEVVDTDATHAHGMMFRTELAAGKGMLFVWPAPRYTVFWMKNTLIPLDIIFINQGKVVGVIAWAKPRDETPLDPGVDSDMVLEVPGGWAVENGITTGWTVAFPK